MRTPLTLAVVLGTDADRTLVSSFARLPQVELRWVCDDRAAPRGDAAVWAPGRLTSDYGQLLADEALDAVVFAAPAHLRGERPREALEADKHVLLAGPAATTEAAADELARLAEARGRRLWTYEPIRFRPSLRRVRALAERGALGELFYVHVERHRAGGARDDDRLWALTAETLAVALDLLADQPIEVAARTESYTGSGAAEVLFVGLRFATGITARLHVSSLDASGTDRIAVVGSAATAVVDLADPRRELIVFGAPDANRTGEQVVGGGDALSVSVPAEDLARLACQGFVDAVRRPVEGDSGRNATAVVAVLEAIVRSCERGGEPEGLERPAGPQPLANVVELPAR